MPNDPQTEARLRAAKFVAHNIPLAPGFSTRPGEPLIGESPRTQAIHDALRLFMPGGVQGKTAVDLGCLEGGLTYELWQAGLDVLGVEVREDNLERCRLVREWFGAHERMDFVQADVRQFQPARAFDVVLCSGLLYHLDDPAAYIGQLGGLTAPGGLLYLDTHVAPEDVEMAECEYRDYLSPLKTGERNGLPVRWREYAEDVTQAESSIGNTVSLWLDVASHVDLLLHAGFDRVFEMHGYFGPREMALKRRYARRYWVALKHA
ncbi:class I SAM-dependent methyltransferase [Ramlibacter albus]|uniref:Methyltransferase domain-containing protein n=1 Tax=Ramlibacter albus TaxID=2079448 RepID=A0A923S577_9BURK|nr:methyltransferase domain-containing protein [Ramlibacter albus]MBC5764887.1 methyltransferase domain-containing protein [Ramlibacter albus]